MYRRQAAKTYLLLVLLAHRARSTLLQLARCINYLLTYLLLHDDIVTRTMWSSRLDQPQGQKIVLVLMKLPTYIIGKVYNLYAHSFVYTLSQATR